ncbi:MAG: hypothetical protein GY751_03150 [Bacteroidetes bacterium]|nr:hypothetical protein [Bacteroidota bacterium]
MICALVFTTAFYGKVLLQPDHYMFGTEGDALKNYFTYYYHINHDISPFESKGMNYPYGESYLYTDCQPILTHFVRAVGNVIPSMPQKCIGFLNVLMILSIFATFFLLYAVLLEFDIFPWIAVLFAIAITILQPQIFRMNVHFSMSYSVAIPLTWLLMTRLYKGIHRNRYTVLLLLSNIFWMLILAYVGMILILFQICFWLVAIVYERRAYLERFMYLLFSAIPVVGYIVLTRLTDHHTGRTDNPWGFFYFNAEPDDLFLPHHPPFRHIWDSLLRVEIVQKWEAWNYVGLAFTIVLLLFVLMFIFRVVTRHVPLLYNHMTRNRAMNISFIASLLVLMYAMGIPFKQVPVLADWIPFVKQFRTTGRFGWVFFYVASVFSVCLIQSYFEKYRHLGKKVVAYAIVLVSFSLTLVEGLAYHVEMANKIKEHPNMFASRSLDQFDKEVLSIIGKGDYQAFLPLPFFYWGSENFSRMRGAETVLQSFRLAAVSGLPMISMFSSRTSIAESRNIIQLISPGYYDKPIKEEIKRNNPFLILKTNQALTKYESSILQRSAKLLDGPRFSLYQLEVDSLFKSTSVEAWGVYEAKKELLVLKGDFLVDDSESLVFYDGFEMSHPENTHPRRGQHNFAGEKGKKHDLARIDAGNFSKNELYVASLWMYNGRLDALNESLRLVVHEHNAAEDVWYTTGVLAETSEVIDGNWSLVEVEFSISHPDNVIYIALEGTSISTGLIIADDLLIMKKEGVVYRESEDEEGKRLFYNNHDIRQK